MKRRVALLASVALIVPAGYAQQVQWLNAAPVGWDLNYGMPSHLIKASHNGQVSVARQFGDGISYGQDIFNSVMIERIDPATGSPDGSCPMVDSVLVESITVGDDGTTYVAGRFMGAIQFCDGSVLGGGPGFLETDLFIAAFGGPDFAPLWSRNLSISHPDGLRVPAMEIDVTGNVWYGIEEFGTIHLIRIDEQGNDLEERIISGTRMLGGFSFDPSNNIFVSGSTGQNESPLVFGGQSVPVTETYMMFVLHFDVNGNGSWARLAHDQTFSAPDVVAGGYGEAFVSGTLMDSTSWGDVHFHGPNWVFDVFLARVSAAGEFTWGTETAPEGEEFTGDMRRSKGPGIACDGNANVYLTGVVRGQVDWGNGVVSDAVETFLDAQTLVCFANNGAPLWQRTSDPGAMNAQNVSCDEAGNVFISTHTLGTFGFAPDLVNVAAEQAFADARIDAQSTWVVEGAVPGTIPVWPVPSATAILVSGIADRVGYRMISATGSLVLRGMLARGVNSIDIASLTSGPYSLVLDDGRVSRVIKE